MTHNVKYVFLSYLCDHVQTRDEHWTGLGLGWIQTMMNFVEFGLDPDCK